MAKYVLKDADVVINGVNLSNRVDEVVVNMSREDVETTAMGASGKQRLAGLGDDSFEVTFLQDHAAANVDATLFPLLGAAPFTVVVKPTSAAVSATNPTFTGSCILTEYTPIQGSVGSRSEATVTLPVDGTITRATA